MSRNGLSLLKKPIVVFYEEQFLGVSHKAHIASTAFIQREGGVIAWYSC